MVVGRDGQHLDSGVGLSPVLATLAKQTAAQKRTRNSAMTDLNSARAQQRTDGTNGCARLAALEVVTANEGALLLRELDAAGNEAVRACQERT